MRHEISYQQSSPQLSPLKYVWFSRLHHRSHWLYWRSNRPTYPGSWLQGQIERSPWIANPGSSPCLWQLCRQSGLRCCSWLHHPQRFWCCAQGCHSCDSCRFSTRGRCRGPPDPCRQGHDFGAGVCSQHPNDQESRYYCLGGFADSSRRQLWWCSRKR